MNRNSSRGGAGAPTPSAETPGEQALEKADANNWGSYPELTTNLHRFIFLFLSGFPIKTAFDDDAAAAEGCILEAPAAACGKNNTCDIGATAAEGCILEAPAVAC